MDEHSLVSIIVPVYNIEKYVVKCIESILNQRYGNIEIILVDDGSRDSSGQICDVYAQKDQRIHVIHKVNGGLSDARNTGLEFAAGDYILFVDGDDFIAPEMCDTLLNAIHACNAEIAICNFQSVNETGNCSAEYNLVIKDGVLPGRTIIEEKIHDGDGWIWCVTWNKLYHKELFKNVRFPVGKLHEDEFVFFGLLSQCERVACVEKPLYYYMQREGSIMAAPFSVRRLDGCEAIIQRIGKMIGSGYSAESIYRTIKRSVILLCAVFDHKVYTDPVYRARYRELLQLFREIGFGKLLGSVKGIKRKAMIAIGYIDPAIYWRLKKIKNGLKK